METNNKQCKALDELVANIELRASVLVFGTFPIIDRKTFLDAKAVLAKLPRNCDVGTADEQCDRWFNEYCKLHPTCRKWLRKDVPSMCISCFAKWAQRPYKKRGTK